MRRLTIAEMARETGLSAHTLRYYERVGLLHAIARADSGHRRYGEADVAWVAFLHKLRSTGMPIREMQAYAALVRQGGETSDERQALLTAHRARVVQQIADLTENLAQIEWKIARYQKGEFK